MVVDLIIKNCKIADVGFECDRDATIVVDNGKIASISLLDDVPESDEVINAEGNLVVPGLIDDHIHTREPGDEDMEDWTSVTRGAAAGGVSTVIAMPNTDPFIETPDQLEQVYEIADRKSIVDYQSYGLLTADNLDQIHPLAEAGAAGYKCFLAASNVEFPIPDDGELFAAMEEIAKAGIPIGFHEENNDIIRHQREKFKHEGRDEPADHEPSRPVVAEEEAVARVGLFAKRTGCPTHLFHVSSGSAAEIIAELKQDAPNITSETLPQFLWFSADVLEEKGTIAKMNPPLRQKEEVEKLWEVGIYGDGIDCIASDHAPHTDEEKGVENPFGSIWESASGFVGIETVSPAMLTFVNDGKISMEDWIRMHSKRPAQIWGMYPKKGSLRLGTDADLAIVDPAREWTLDRDDLQSKTKATPFEGETFTGAITKTIVRGELVYDEGEFPVQPGYGEFVSVERRPQA